MKIEFIATHLAIIIMSSNPVDVVNKNEDIEISGPYGSPLVRDGWDLILDDPANGTIELLPSGSILYTPNQNYIGPDEFSITISTGNLTAKAIKTIYVNDPVSGDVRIDGLALPSSKLEVLCNIFDGNGLGELNYQWQINNVDVVGANESIYHLPADYSGEAITVDVSYTHGGGVAEKITSASISSHHIRVLRDSEIVNSVYAGLQWQVDLNYLTNGRFVATWTDESEMLGDNSSAGIVAQLFDKDGNKLGSSFLVNSGVKWGQTNSIITPLNDGLFAVTWSDFSRRTDDPDLYAVRTQIFDNDGTKVGSEVLVNETIAGSQSIKFALNLSDQKILYIYTSGEAGINFGRIHNIQNGSFGDEFQLSVADLAISPNSDLYSLTHDSTYEFENFNDQHNTNFITSDPGVERIESLTINQHNPTNFEISESKFLAAVKVGNNGGGIRDPKISYVSEDELSVAWLEHIWSADNNIASYLNVATYSVSEEIITNQRTLPIFSVSKPSKLNLTVTDDGYKFVSWQLAVDDSDIFFAVLDDSLNLLISPQLAHDLKIEEQSYPSMAASQDGELLIAYQDYSNSHPDYDLASIRLSQFKLLKPQSSDFEIILGDEFNDYILAGEGADLVSAGAGSDTIELWSSSAYHYGYYARNIETGSRVSIRYKTKYSSVIDGEADADTIILMDSSNGDAFFLHDAYSDLHESVSTTSDDKGMQTAARVISIETILAGDGNDIIDLTSDTFDMGGSNITLKGEAGDDVLWAAEGNDTLDGGLGDDTLFGGDGNDILTGGDGADVFEFVNSDTTQTDTITDYTSDDTLRFYLGDGDNQITQADYQNGTLKWGNLTIAFEDRIGTGSDNDINDLSIVYV